MKGTQKARAVAAGLFVVAVFPLLADDGLWTTEGLGHTAVFSLGLGQPPRTIFASTFYGVLRSPLQGVWNALPGTNQNAAPIAVDPSDPRVLYAAGEDSHLLKSTDNGDHFEVLSGISLSVFGAIAVDPVETSTLYAGGSNNNGGIVNKSRDGGASWSALPTDTLVEGIASLVVDPRRIETLYAGSWVHYDYPGYPPAVSDNNALIGSQDAGASWTPLLGQTHFNTSIYGVNALTVDAQTGIVYAGVHDSEGTAIYRSAGFGSGFTRIPVGMGLNVFGINAIVVDPATPTTLYAGTSTGGVFQSLDGGSNWVPMNDGLFDDPQYGHSGLWVHSLVLDPTDGVLRAGTENGVFAIRPNAPSLSCTPTENHLCLLGGRYRVSVMAQNPRTLEVARGVVVEQADRFGSFSLPPFTGDATFPEVAVKMLDPSQGRGVWVFHGSLTSFPYILTVTDTTTGLVETYTNDRRNGFCGGADTEAFFSNASGPWDYRAAASATSGAKSAGSALSLLGGRFSVTLSAFSARQNRTEQGTAVARTDRYGYFSLPGFTGNASFPEVYVKMVDYTAFTGKFWFLYGGLTSLDYTLTVTDSVTGQTRTYESSRDFCGGGDVRAFPD